MAGASADFEIARAEDLPFGAESFDVVVAITVLCFIENPAKALREMTRILKPGGRLIVGELGRYSSWAALRRIKGWFGSPVWRHAHFHSASDLRRFAKVEPLELDGVRGLLVTQLDRDTDKGLVRRIHQEDFCQALGLPKSPKYECGGQGERAFNAAAVGKLLSRTRLPAKARQLFLQMTIVNLVVGIRASGKSG